MAGGTPNDYERGSMEIGEQSSTWSLFMLMTKWGSLAIAVGVLFLVLWFMPQGSFLTALVVSVVMLALGIVLLREKPARH